MSAALFLRRGLVCCLLALGASPSPAAGPDGPEKPTKDKQGKSEGKERETVAAMVDAMANHNKPPKLVDISKDGPALPLFPDEYDWKEHERVRAALGKVRRERTPEMWEELVRRIDDKRYCLTLQDKNESYCIGNKSAGYFCAGLADDWLFGVCNRHLPTDPNKEGYPLVLYIGPTSSWKEWRKERADKQLYELQIEVCEETIRAMETVAKVPQREKDRAREKIEAEIAGLKKTKKPIFTDYSIDYNPAYTEKTAKEAREELQRKP